MFRSGLAAAQVALTARLLQREHGYLAAAGKDSARGAVDPNDVLRSWRTEFSIPERAVQAAQRHLGLFAFTSEDYTVWEDAVVSMAPRPQAAAALNGLLAAGSILAGLSHAWGLHPRWEEVALRGWAPADSLASLVSHQADNTDEGRGA